MLSVFLKSVVVVLTTGILSVYLIGILYTTHRIMESKRYHEVVRCILGIWFLLLGAFVALFASSWLIDLKEFLDRV